MVQPFDYRTTVAQPMAGALTGIQSALQMSQQMDASDAEQQRAKLYQAQTAAAQQEVLDKQAKAAQAEALRKEVEDVARAPDTAKITGLMIKYPHLSEGFNRALGAASADEKSARVLEGTQAYAAILNGDIPTAKAVLTDTAAALRDKGNAPQAEAYERMAKLIEANPAGAQTTIGLMLATAMGADKFQATFKELEDQRRTKEGEPVARRAAAAAANKAESDAATAAVTAKYAESNAAKDLEKKGWDITKIQEDIKIHKLNAQIASAGVAAAREMNGLKREELRIQIRGMEEKRDQTTRERAAEITSARNTIDTLLNTADQVLQVPRGTKNSALGPINSRLPTLSQDVADFEERVGTLGSQTFLAQVPSMKGLGALTEAEGAKLERALGSFSMRQSPEQFDANVRESQRLMLKARKNLETKYGAAPTTPDTPAAAGDAAAVAAALDKYGPKAGGASAKY